MKRHPKLHALSSEHHAALVLARKLARHTGAWTVADATALQDRFARELEPHFRVEEELLLPALQDAGRMDLAERTSSDHTALRAFVAAGPTDDETSVRAFADRLREHVRFEEHELFPSCEALLSEAALARLPGREGRGTK